MAGLDAVKIRKGNIDFPIEKKYSKGMNQCEDCAYYAYDEEYEEYYCEADMDEDDLAAILGGQKTRSCPYYRDGDEYKVVRHQM